jgi:hypothetical protein
MRPFLNTLPLLVISLLTQCTTLPSSTLFEAHPALVHDKSQQPDLPPVSKAYKLQSDWSGDGWVVKRGAEIRFNADGTGEFSCVTYAHPDLALPNAVQFQALQYGPDGNLLFGVPSSDVGESLHLRSPMRDYPYRMPFGFNKAYFKDLTSVRFMGRLLKPMVPPLPAPPPMSSK